MSGSTPTPTAASAEPASLPEPTWAKPSVSVYAMTIFLVCLAIAYFSKDSTSLTMLIGASIAMSQQVVGYWLGSSSGSTAKTALIQAANATPTAPAPQPPAAQP